MEMYICQTCGHIAFNAKPDKCPVCGTYLFERNDRVFTESESKSPEASVKHIPAVTVNKECAFIPENSCVDVMVRIGATLHPMEEKHYIQFIDCYLDWKYLGRVYLTPNLNPATCFHLKEKRGKIAIVECCSIHGYWMAEDVIIG